MRHMFFASVAVLAFAAATSAQAEEGMWTYDNFPNARPMGRGHGSLPAINIG